MRRRWTQPTTKRAQHHGAEVLAVVEVLLAHGADPRSLCHGQRPADMCGAHAHKARARLEQARELAAENISIEM